MWNVMALKPKKTPVLFLGKPQNLLRPLRRPFLNTLNKSWWLSLYSVAGVVLEDLYLDSYNGQSDICYGSWNTRVSEELFKEDMISSNLKRTSPVVSLIDIHDQKASVIRSDYDNWELKEMSEDNDIKEILQPPGFGRPGALGSKAGINLKSTFFVSQTDFDCLETD
ncbi:hypothetical protein J6590_006623 [Homalodisca vitripennis]|nr:hypothetical protein J6590_006623 [Homalodisca vitripennis]